MLQIIDCYQCNKQLDSVTCEAFIHVNMHLFRPPCKSCHNADGQEFRVSFCSIKCLKKWLDNKKDVGDCERAMQRRNIAFTKSVADKIKKVNKL